MRASVDVDVVAHLGDFVNVDLLQKGVYRVRITLKCGNAPNHIAPVGIFSSASTLDSFVGSLRLPSPGLVAPCEVDDSQHVFLSRAFVIMYRNESHELNEGVQWRLTFPQLDMSANADLGPITSPDRLHVKFELLFCELIPSAAPVPPEMVSSLIPKKLVFEVVSTQNLVLQKVSSDLHQYYPVTFSNPYTTGLDVMFHACITGIRYEHIEVPSEGEFREDPKERAPSDEMGPASTPSEKLSVADGLSMKDDDDEVGFGSPGDSLRRSSFSTSWRSESYSRSNSVQVDSNGFLRGDITTKHNPTLRTGPAPEAAATVAPPAGGNLDDHEVLEQVFGDEYIRRREQIRHFDPPNDPPPPAGSTQTNSSAPPLLTPPSAPDPSASTQPPQPVFKHSAQRRATTLISSTTSGNAADPAARMPLVQSLMNLVKARTPPPDSPTPTTGKNATATASLAPSTFNPEPRRSLFARFRRPDEESEKEAPEEKGGLLPHHTGKHTTAKPSKILSSSFADSAPRLPMASPPSAHGFDGDSADDTSGPSARAGAGIVLSPAQIEATFDHYASAVIHNFQLTVTTTRQMLAEYHMQNAQDNSENTRTAATLLQSQLSEECVLFEQRREILEELIKAPALGDVQRQLRKHVDSCNIQLSLRWSVLLVAMRRMLPVLRTQLKEVYNLAAKVFWKQQTMLCSRTIASPRELVWNSDDSALQELHRLIESERAHDKAVICGHAEPARGAPVYDLDTQLLPSRLPYIYLEQCVLAGAPPLPLYDSLYMDLPPPPHTHLCVLVHGFLGAEPDLWLLSQALRLHLREGATIYIPKCNEQAQTESIAVMGRNLANDLLTYLESSCPEMLAPGRSFCREQRISFFAHSLGGLVVRQALLDERMQALHGKLHLFVSMACPHLGTLYMSSSLVSAGMWALSTFKPYKSLRELSLEEEAGDNGGALLVSLARSPPAPLRDLWGSFQRIVLLSSPEDHYVPSYSASIEVPPSIAADARGGQSVQEMAEQLLARVPPQRLVRMTLFNLSSASASNQLQAYTKGNAFAQHGGQHAMAEALLHMEAPAPRRASLEINDAIGRTAHICFLENAPFARQLVFALLPYLLERQGVF